jgi:hypothetical protein
MQFITSWERKGIEQGLSEGLLRSRREVLLYQLNEKFGTLPQSISQQVQTIASVEELDRLLRKLIHANSLAEIGLDSARG